VSGTRVTKENPANWPVLYCIAALGVIPIGVTLWLWGQPLVCTSGELALWVNSPWSRENSQQVADWYSLSHVIHGVLLGALGGLFALRGGRVWALLLAVVTGVGWEIVEHTDMVLDRFRGETIYQGYVGDTVLNACCDYGFMLGGFILMQRLALVWALPIVLGLELLSMVVVRDSLTLTTIRVVHPIPAISAWQDAGKPDALRQVEPGD
jgi:hypothetical protein